MDDKLIIFKKNAMYYITGDGPDNTGANNDFTTPVFISSVVGCTNQNSIVLTPMGLMFQSDKGIWLLGRDLSTQYIGAPVEQYNTATVQAAINIPATNQVRFTLSSGVTLLYDHYYSQWGTFTGIPGVSSAVYGSLHTFLNAAGLVFQENPGSYIDGSVPVLLKLTTAWIQAAGIQGYQRLYYFFLLGQYLSPHKLTVQIAADYDPAILQAATILPQNYSAPFGDDSPFGSGTPFGGPSAVEQFRINIMRQKCQALQITIIETYDPTFGAAAGAGLTLSGLNFVIGVKKGYPKISPKMATG
jgi:hypothetical protein